MDSRTKLEMLLIVYLVQVTLAAPTWSWESATDPSLRFRSEGKETGRIFWSAMGDILEALPFLPFTVNVPDAVSGVWNFFSGFFPGGSSDSTPSGSSGNKKPKGNSTSTAPPITRQDIVDYLLY